MADEHFGICPPVDVPMVRVVDENDTELFRGWYYRHIKRTPHVGEKVNEDDVVHVVMHDGFSDWNLPREPIATEVTPPHRIEVIEDYKPWEIGH